MHLPSCSKTELERFSLLSSHLTEGVTGVTGMKVKSYESFPLYLGELYCFFCISCDVWISQRIQKLHSHFGRYGAETLVTRPSL